MSGDGGMPDVVIHTLVSGGAESGVNMGNAGMMDGQGQGQMGMSMIDPSLQVSHL